jgi:hypothetical protein
MNATSVNVAIAEVVSTSFNSPSSLLIEYAECGVWNVVVQRCTRSKGEMNRTMDQSHYYRVESISIRLKEDESNPVITQFAQNTK